MVPNIFPAKLFSKPMQSGSVLRVNRGGALHAVGKACFGEVVNGEKPGVALRKIIGTMS